MSIERIANRYAHTLINAAVEQQKVEEVYNDALVFENAMENSRELVLLLESPIINADKKIKALTAVFRESVGSLFLSFVEVICRKGREPYMESIINTLKEVYKSEKGITEVEVVTAADVDENTLENIKEKVRSLPFVREHVQMKHSVDPGILGGFIIRYEDKVYDASVAHDLETLRRQIAR